MERKIIPILVLVTLLVCTEVQLLALNCDSPPKLEETCCGLPILYQSCLERCDVKNIYTGVTKKCYNKHTSECLKECFVDSSNGTVTHSDDFNSPTVLEGLLIMTVDDPGFQPIVDNAFVICTTSVSGLPITCDKTESLGIMLWCVSTQMMANCPQDRLITAPDCECLNTYLQNCI